MCKKLTKIDFDNEIEHFKNEVSKLGIDVVELWKHVVSIEYNNRFDVKIIFDNKDYFIITYDWLHDLGFSWTYCVKSCHDYVFSTIGTKYYLNKIIGKEIKEHFYIEDCEMFKFNENQNSQLELWEDWKVNGESKGGPFVTKIDERIGFRNIGIRKSLIEYFHCIDNSIKNKLIELGLDYTKTKGKWKLTIERFWDIDSDKKTVTLTLNKKTFKIKMEGYNKVNNVYRNVDIMEQRKFANNEKFIEWYNENTK